MQETSGSKVQTFILCMTATLYNQVPVMIDHFTKYAEAAPCMRASAEETCNHLINVWIARHGCTITFQSDNGKAFVGDLTKELMKRSQVAQAHSITYHPQTKSLVERQNRTLVSILRAHSITFHHGNKSAYEGYWPRESSSINILLP